MERFARLTALAAPLIKSNVDTEVIIPIARLIEFAPGQLGPFCFEPWRFHADGSPDDSFSLNQAAHRGAQILITGANFGCGSSREAAVWALRDMGIRVIVAESFGDIFQANCFQNGLLPIILAARDLARVVLQVSTAAVPRMTIDLERCEMLLPSGEPIAFTIDPERRMSLIEGADDIELTLRLAGDIEAFERHDQLARPWHYPAAAGA